MLEDAHGKTSDYLPFLAMGGFIVLVDLLALSVSNLFNSNGATVFENPGDPSNLLFIVATTLVFSGVVLLIVRLRLLLILKGIFLVSIGSMTLIVLYMLLIGFIPDPWASGLSIAASIVMIALLVKHPEWYVIDACGVIIGVGSTTLFGISLSVPLVVVLLAVMAIYDAISVYKTKHMIDLADAVMKLRIPVMLIIPKGKGYSFIKETRSLKEKLEGGERREAFFLGLGDVVFPGIFVVSTFTNITGNGLTIAIAVIAGTLLGFAVLTTFAVKGKPQAGLPFLCSGALLGYFASTILLYGRLFV